jgi:DNA repair exonuclease SbcCD ATPase subunit
MKVDSNITLFVGGQPGDSLATEGSGKKQENRKTIFAGDLNPQENSLQSRIEQRKKEAQKQAMKVVGDAFDGDKAIDEDIEKRHQNIEELVEDRQRLLDEKAGVDARAEDLEKAYEAGEVSAEDYAVEKKNLREETQVYENQISANENQVKQENSTIRATKIEKLKHREMDKAQEQAEDILDAARDEIVGMVVEDGKDHIEEEAEKREEQAEEIKEEKEELEERIEEQKEHRKEEEEILEEMPTEEMLTLDKMQTDVKQEVQNILNKMKLIQEDIKGAAVDTTC